MANNFATKPKGKLTDHQIDLLRIIVKGNPATDVPEDAFADLDQVLERAMRKTTKSSLQFTIRALVINGMIEKLPPQQRRGRMRVLYKPTPYGSGIGADRPVLPGFVVPLREDKTDFEPQLN